MRPILILSIIFLHSCQKAKDTDCSNIRGATYSSNTGKVQSIIILKCSGSACHSAGVTGNDWAYSGDINVMSTHFEHMYEQVIDKKMPPEGSAQLTTDEINVFKCWQQSGFPQ